MDEAGRYLALADMFSIGSIITISSVKENRYKLILFLLALSTILILHSRSALFFFILSSLFLFSIKKKFLIYFTNLLLISIFIFFYINVVENQRLLLLFDDPFSDSSLNSRLFMFFDGLSDINENFFYGKYGGQIIQYGESGYYIHNILSYWRQFGFITFLLSIIVFIIKPIFLINKLKREKSVFLNLFRSLFIFSFFSIIFQEHLIGILFGCWLVFHLI